MYGWQTLFILEAMPALLFTFVFLFWVKDRPEKASWLTAAEKAYLTDAYAAEKARLENVKKYTVMQALTNPKVLRLCLIYFLWIVGFWGFNFWMPQVLKGLSGWSASLVGFAIAIPMLCVNMKKTSLEKVCQALETLEPRIQVPEKVRQPAAASLTRMLEIKGR